MASILLASIGQGSQQSHPGARRRDIDSTFEWGNIKCLEKRELGYVVETNFGKYYLTQ